jgi:hypothetical protein
MTNAVGLTPRTTSSALASMVVPSMSTNALGIPRPSLTPEPAATMTIPTVGMGD